MNTLTANDVIRKLNLEPMPAEGGYFRQTYLSPVKSKIDTMPEQSLERAAGTAIYFMITHDNFSALHRLVFDEIYHFYGGDPVELFQINENGVLTKSVLGADIANNQSPQIAVPKGMWQGSRVVAGGKWSLMGATMAPGFEYADYELGNQENLCNAFPEHSNLIKTLTRIEPL